MRRILFIALAGSLLFCGCARKVSPAAVTPEATAPEATPLVTAAAEKNASDHACFELRTEADDGVLHALYGYFRDTIGPADFFDARVKGDDGARIRLYAAVPYKDGMLALADFSMDGETAPDLFYIIDGEVQSATSGTDPWSVPYTRIGGDTIVYGKSFAWDNGPLKTTHITAVFCDGQTVTQDLTAEKGAPQPGYIIPVTGQTYLDSLTIYDKSNVVVDDTNADFVLAELKDRFAKDYSICEFLRFCPMQSARERERAMADTESGAKKVSVGETATGLLCWYKGLGATMPDLWRTINACPPITVTGGETLEWLGLNSADIRRIYWVEPALDDGTPEGIAKAVREAELPAETDSGDAGGTQGGSNITLPASQGQYMLIVECGDRYYTSYFNIEKP